MYIQNDFQGLIHVPQKKYSVNAFLKTVKANQSHTTIFQNSIRSNSIFELSFVGIHQRLTEIWLFAIESQNKV